MVYFLVNLGAFKVIRGSLLSRTLIFLSVLGCLFAIAVWFMFTINHSPVSLGIFAFFLVTALVAEAVLQKVKGRRIQAHHQ